MIRRDSRASCVAPAGKWKWGLGGNVEQLGPELLLRALFHVEQFGSRVFLRALFHVEPWVLRAVACNQIRTYRWSGEKQQGLHVSRPLEAKVGLGECSTWNNLSPERLPAHCSTWNNLGPEPLDWPQVRSTLLLNTAGKEPTVTAPWRTAWRG